MTDNWWARQLGQQPQAPQPPQQAPQQPQYAPQAPVGPPQQFQGYPQQQAPQQPPVVTGANLWEAAQQWQGGEATRTETQLCPQCGSNHYFSKAQSASRMPAPAPECFTCGYNGMFQQGDPSNWNAA